MKTSIKLIAVAVLAVSSFSVSANAISGNNTMDYKVAYDSVMAHAKAGQWEQVEAELPRLGYVDGWFDKVLPLHDAAALDAKMLKPALNPIPSGSGIVTPVVASKPAVEHQTADAHNYVWSAQQAKEKADKAIAAGLRVEEASAHTVRYNVQPEGNTKEQGDALVKANQQRTRQQVLAGGEAEVGALIQAQNDAKQAGEEQQQANRERTRSQHVTPEAKAPTNGANGINGKDGSNGEAGRNGVDGVTTVRTVNVVDTATRNQVAGNSAAIEANRSEIITQSRSIVANHNAIQHNSAAIEHNSQRIDKNSKDISENRKAIKSVGAMAQASANLHYNVNHNGYALAVGEYDGSTAIASGVQFQTSAHTAVTVQASYDDNAVGGSVGFHGDF